MDRDTLTSTPISRRNVLVGGALAGMAAFLAACGAKGTATTAPESVAPTAAAPSASEAAAASEVASAPASAAAPVATPSAELNWANWTYYMDVDPNDQTKHPTLEAFTAKYGTVVHYQEVVDGNDEFVAKIADAAKAGKDTGWDLITLTDWMAAKLIRLGWVDTFDSANVPNLIANIKDVYRNLPWDPDNSQHAPWRSGTTGLGFNVDVTGDVTSLAALYTVDPQDQGQGRIPDTFDGGHAACSVAFSPDGNSALFGSGNVAVGGYGIGDVKLWDLVTGKLLRTFEGHSVAFSPDGHTLLSGSNDGGVRFWNLATGQGDGSDAPLVTMFAKRKDGWLAITPAGFFAASSAARAATW